MQVNHIKRYCTIYGDENENCFENIIEKYNSGKNEVNFDFEYYGKNNDYKIKIEAFINTLKKLNIYGTMYGFDSEAQKWTETNEIINYDNYKIDTHINWKIIIKFNFVFSDVN